MKMINGLPVFEVGNTSNPAIFFVHGFLLDNTMWNYQIEFLKNKYYCVSYDFRGMGKSLVEDGQYTIEAFVDEIELILNELKIEKTIICGLSMGGYISFRAIEKFYDRFNGAIFCDTRATADSNQGKLKRAAAIKQINSEGLDSYVESFFSNIFGKKFKSINSVAYEQHLNAAKKINPIGVKGCQLAMMGRNDSLDFLPQINFPVLAICGDEDSLTPPIEMKYFADKIPNCNFHIIKEAGHMSPVEEPIIVNKIIEDFLKKSF